jgi:hypothetical protein
MMLFFLARLLPFLSKLVRQAEAADWRKKGTPADVADV